MSQRYNLLLTGNILPGHKREAVAAALAKLMRVPETQALQLLSGQERVIKSNIDDATLGSYFQAIRNAGAATRVHPLTVAEEFAARRVAAPEMAGDEDVPLSDEDFKALLRELEAPTPDAAGKMQCPCCKYHSLRQRGAGEECKWCGWRDYPGQNEFYPDKVVPGRNFDLSLNEAQKEWETYYSLNPADYTPNEVPLKKRVVNVGLALLVMAYSGYSLWAGKFVMAGSSRGRVEVVTFVGIEVWIMTLACLSAAAFGVLSVMDHFDRRRNERGYRKIGAACFVLMAAMMGLAMTSFFYREYGVGGAIAGCIFIVVIVSAIIYRIKTYGPIEY